MRDLKIVFVLIRSELREVVLDLGPRIVIRFEFEKYFFALIRSSCFLLGLTKMTSKRRNYNDEVSKMISCGFKSVLLDL